MSLLPSRLPLLAAAGAIAVLSGMDALIKEVAAAHGTAQVVMMRYLFGFLAIAAVLAVSGAARPTRATFRRAAFRVVFMLGTAFLFFKTLTLLPLAEAVAITFTAPFFMLVTSRLLLKEPMPARALGAIGLGFAGVLVMVAGGTGLGGGGHGSWLGYATGLGCSVTYALSMVLMRRDSGHDPVIALVFAQNAACLTASIPFGAAAWTAPSTDTLLLFAGVGLLGTAGHLLFAFAYSRAPAARLAPLEYTAFLWASLFGLVFFGEIPSPWALAGAVMIVAACLLVLGRPSEPVATPV